MNTLQSLVVKKATKDREGDGRRQLPIAGGAPERGLQRERGDSRDCGEMTAFALVWHFLLFPSWRWPTSLVGSPRGCQSPPIIRI